MRLIKASSSSKNSRFHATERQGRPRFGAEQRFRRPELQLPWSPAFVRQSTPGVALSQSELRQPPASPPLTSIFLGATQRLAAPSWKGKSLLGNVEKSPVDTMLYLEDYLESEFGALPRPPGTRTRTLSARRVSFPGPRPTGR